MRCWLRTGSMGNNGKNGSLDCDIRLCNSKCCRNCPVLTENEVHELIKNVKEKYDLELVLKKYFRRVKGEHGIYYAVKMIKGQCIFLDREKRCRIYMCRPLLCELYPVLDVDAVDEQCPAVSMKKIPGSFLDILKKRYADEVDKRMKNEQTFRFI